MRNWKRTATVIMAALIALRSLTNIFKPLGAGSGLVFFGKLLGGALNVILAPAVGIFMLAYAYGMFDRRKYALPMGIAYVVYVIFNVVLFPVLQALPGGWGLGVYSIFGVVSIAGAVFPAWLMWAQRNELI